MKRMFRWLTAILVVAAAGPARAATPESAGNTAPVAAIRSPVDGSSFKAGRTIALIANASDAEDAAAALSYRWTVDLLQGDRVESGFFTGSEPSLFFAVEDLDQPLGVSLAVRLVVTDAGGLSDTAKATVTAVEDLEGAYPVGPGDMLDVVYYAGAKRQEEFSAEVSAYGTVTAPLVGEMSVGGLTANEIADKLTVVLSRDFFVNPQVLVKVREQAKKIFVAGEVKKPGAYSLREGSTVMNACVLAGGFSDYAALNRVVITRTVGRQTKLIKVDLREVQRGKTADVLLETGDRIDVPHRLF